MRYLLLAAAFMMAACQPKTDIKAHSKPGAYMIVSGKNYNANDLGPYAAALPPIYEKYGGHYVALAPKYDVMEGSSDAQAIIVSAWPSVQAAKTFWLSPEYEDAKKLRDGIGEFDVVIVPALTAQ